MNLDELQALCEAGQRELMATNYLAAEKILAQAEQIAVDHGAWIPAVKERVRQSDGSSRFVFEFDGSKPREVLAQAI